MNMTWLHPRWLFSRRTTKTLLWTAVIVAAAVVANTAGIYLIGNVAGWENWLTANADYFLAWRLCVYGATVYGWIWMRRRLLARETDAQARHRLVRGEMASVIAILALEISLLMHVG